MVFGQLTHRESLFDTILCLNANSNKLYHIGIGEAIAKSTLSTIDTCLSLFQWANFRSTKAGIKLNVQLDLRSAIPEFIQITPAAIHEVNILNTIHYRIS